MTADTLNRWLTLGANVGVLIGIVLLLIELNQNETMMRAQTRTELSNGIVEVLSMSASNPQLAGLIRRADDGEELSAEELLQFEHRSFALFRYLENLNYQYRLGLYDEQEYSAQRNAWGSYLNRSKAAVMVWCDYRLTVSPEFRAEVDSQLQRHTC